MKSIVDEGNLCIFCGAAAEPHHLVFGFSQRELADQDLLILPVCRAHHTSGEKLRRIHDNIMAERLSKMLGQVCWEKHKIAEKGFTEKEAREEFIKRYGRSYF